MRFNYLYYFAKPIVPRWLQIILRRKLVAKKIPLFSDIWPIDPKANKPPRGWSGWPCKKQFALVLTHDVEKEGGLRKCYDLIRMEHNLGFRSCFNFVPERYDVPAELRKYLIENGFEVGVHGLYHDGKLYKSEIIFRQRAQRINQYLEQWGAVGFRSPAMHHNLSWILDLNIEYDASTFDTDPFEPQPEGVGTVFPFWVDGNYSQKGFLELPYTLPQDFTLFVLMKEKSINIWQRKLEWIAENGGMALLNTHPDYMNINTGKQGIEEYPARYYVEFLEYIKHKYKGQYWHVLPKQIASYWSGNFGDRKTDSVSSQEIV